MRVTRDKRKYSERLKFLYAQLFIINPSRSIVYRVSFSCIGILNFSTLFWALFVLNVRYVGNMVESLNFWQVAIMDPDLFLSFKLTLVDI